MYIYIAFFYVLNRVDARTDKHSNKLIIVIVEKISIDLALNQIFRKSFASVNSSRLYKLLLFAST